MVVWVGDYDEVGDEVGEVVGSLLYCGVYVYEIVVIMCFDCVVEYGD